VESRFGRVWVNQRVVLIPKKIQAQKKRRLLVSERVKTMHFSKSRFSLYYSSKHSILKKTSLELSVLMNNTSYISSSY